jgi:p-aminobenzoyl-glutamate transporter AbgT
MKTILVLVVVLVAVQSVQAWCSTCWVGTEPEEEKVVVEPLTNSEMMLAIMSNLAKGA